MLSAGSKGEQWGAWTEGGATLPTFHFVPSIVKLAGQPWLAERVQPALIWPGGSRPGRVQSARPSRTARTSRTNPLPSGCKSEVVVSAAEIIIKNNNNNNSNALLILPLLLLLQLLLLNETDAEFNVSGIFDAQGVAVSIT